MTRTAHFYRLLGLAPGADATTLKKAYHHLAKRNHPDLFPDGERRIQQLKMMRINEAYMNLMSEVLDGTAWTTGAFSHAAEPGPSREGGAHATGSRPQPATTSEVGGLRDPAYAYYKAGFRWWQAGLTELFRKDPTELRRNYLEKDKRSDGYILRLAMRALHHFERAYTYFLVVVEQYPTSPWRRDAQWRLGRLENYSAVYQRICDNLSHNLNRVEQPFAPSMNGSIAR